MKFVVALLAAGTLASQTTASPTLTCAECKCGEPKTIDFEEFRRGEYLANDTFADCGLEKLTCKSKDASDSYDRECRILDTEVAYGSWEIINGTDNPWCEAYPCTDDLCSPANCTILNGCVNVRQPRISAAIPTSWLPLWMQR